MNKVFEEKDVTVYWDDRNQWIYADWRNMPNLDTIKKGGGSVLEIIKSKKASKVLNDNTNLTGPWSTSSTWVADVWFPQVIQAGLKKFAWVQSSHDMLGKISADKSVKRNPGDIIAMFSDKSEAEQWLREP